MSPKYSKRFAALAAIVFTTVLLTASNAVAQHFTRTDLTANNANVGNVANIDDSPSEWEKRHSGAYRNSL